MIYKNRILNDVQVHAQKISSGDYTMSGIRQLHDSTQKHKHGGLGHIKSVGTWWAYFFCIHIHNNV